MKTGRKGRGEVGRGQKGEKQREVGRQAGEEGMGKR